MLANLNLHQLGILILTMGLAAVIIVVILHILGLVKRIIYFKLSMGITLVGLLIFELTNNNII